MKVSRAETLTKVASTEADGMAFAANGSGGVMRRPTEPGAPSIDPAPSSTDVDSPTASIGFPFASIRSRPPWGPISFALTVLVPAAACLLYLIFLAAPQYVSETRFVLRGSLEKLALESIGQAAALSALNNSQEAHVVADYIRSQRIIQDLSRDHDLRSLYAGSPLDFIWGLSSDASPDRLVRYWQAMTRADVDATTGIITVRVHAFSPETAQELNRNVVALSEKLIANFSEKMRTQRLEQALADSNAAHAELSTLLAALEAARGHAETIDPLTTATALTTLASTLRDERATLVATRTAAASRMGANAPTIALADERIRSLDAQIELVLSSTTTARNGAAAASDLLTATSLFDLLQTRRELVTRRVARAEMALAQSRQDAIRQQVYVDVFMPPTLGQMKIHPLPLWTTFILTLSLAALWAIAALYFETIRERTR